MPRRHKNTKGAPSSKEPTRAKSRLVLKMSDQKLSSNGEAKWKDRDRSSRKQHPEVFLEVYAAKDKTTETKKKKHKQSYIGKQKQKPTITDNTAKVCTATVLQKQNSCQKNDESYRTTKENLHQKLYKQLPC